MNIFYVDKCPVKAAQALGDKHVVKMTLESAQMLSTAHRVVDGAEYIDTSGKRSVKRWRMQSGIIENGLYKATHVNHPSSVWARGSVKQYFWLRDHFIALCEEYTYRYEKKHKCEELLPLLKFMPTNLSIAGNTFVDPPLAMPDKYMIEGDAVASYRNYYLNEKKDLLKWTKRASPEWMSISTDKKKKKKPSKTTRPKKDA